MTSITSLLGVRRFLPLFIVQFLGALNDNLFKTAALIFIMFSLADQAGLDGALLMPLGAGLFILPYFLFSATAGQMADRYDKAGMARMVKAAEVVIAGFGAAAILMESISGMLAILFLLGLQSTFFGPIKYALLPESLQDRELVAGNALVEGGTFLAILAGTILGGVLIGLGDGASGNGAMLVSGLLVAVAVTGFLASLLIPSTGVSAPGARIGWNVVRETGRIVREARADRPLFLAILGISWFWALGAVFITEFPPFARETLGAGEDVVTLFMAVFSVGIGVGSILCHRLLNGEISVRTVPLASLGVSIFTLDLFFAANGWTLPTTAPISDAALMGVPAFLGTLAGWRILADLVLISVCGGLFAVPLYAFMQHRAPEHRRAQVIAANNVLNALLVVLASLALMGMVMAGLSVPEVFLVTALASFAASVYICAILPRDLLRSVSVWVLKTLYRVEVRGADRLKALDREGVPAVVIANHVSWLDGPLLNAFLPGQSTFAIDRTIFGTWWGGLTRLFADMLAVDSTSPMAVKTMVRAVGAGRRLVIFPEGRITTTGSMMKVYDGPAMVAEKAGATLVPVKIDGAQYSTFSKLAGIVRQRRFPKITIEILDPVTLDVPDDVKGRARRKIAGDALYRVMSDMQFRTQDIDRTLFQALLDARRLHGGKARVVGDVDTLRPSQRLPYDRIILGAHVLGRPLTRITAADETVGVMLPNSAGAVVTFLALQATGRVPAMLNFSTGADAMLSACRTACIRTVLTSRRFIEKGRLEKVVAGLEGQVNVVYLEDVRARLSLADKLVGKWRARSSRAAVESQPDSPAVVLFTSGSEGAPKAVVLSHRNLLANVAQVSARVDFSPRDLVFNALPMFHSFGLTGGTLLPLLSGVPIFLYPSPLHYRIVPELVYDTNATIMFGTDTFLAGYARVANPYDFHTLRYVFAGAEKVRDETRRIFADRFGVRLLEGYGATETAPVLAVNTPMHCKPGTVGRLMPGIETRLEAVPGVDDGQRLSVRGPNVMLGYYLADNPGDLVPPPGGWYDTGDIVEIDSEGFVRIVGRAKRFVKVAGEMVSLAAVEALATEVAPGHAHAAVGVPDERKGEQVILVTDAPTLTRADVMTRARATGRADIMVPREVLVVDKVPLLATGKVDYPAVQRLVGKASREAA